MANETWSTLKRRHLIYFGVLISALVLAGAAVLHQRGTSDGQEAPTAEEGSTLDTGVATEIYRALADVPREHLGAWFQIQELTVRDHLARAVFIVDDHDVFDVVRRQLRESPYFIEKAHIVDVGTMQPMPNGRWRQEYTFRLKEEQN